MRRVKLTGKTCKIALTPVLVEAIFGGGPLTIRGVMDHELRF